jgi:hypothetical protein
MSIIINTRCFPGLRKNRNQPRKCCNLQSVKCLHIPNVTLNIAPSDSGVLQMRYQNSGGTDIQKTLLYN